MVTVAVSDDKDKFLNQLVIDNYQNMVNFASAFFSNRDIAEDAVQETFVVALRKIDILMKSPNPAGWLMNTLKNINGDIYRQRKRLANIFTKLEDIHPSIESVNNFRFEYEGIIDKDELVLLFWIYCDGLSYQEAADILDISLDACKKRIQRAKLRFKQAIKNK